MEKSSVGSQSRQNIKAKTDTKENLSGVKVVKISMIKTDPVRKMMRESKLSKFQGKIRDTEEICGSQSCQDFKPISDPFGKVLRESKLSSFNQI